MADQNRLIQQTPVHEEHWEGPNNGTPKTCRINIIGFKIIGAPNKIGSLIPNKAGKRPDQFVCSVGS